MPRLYIGRGTPRSEGGRVSRSRDHRARWIAGLAALSLLALPRLARADHPFGPGAGWDEARGGRDSIHLWVDPTLGLDGVALIGPWNRLAGWPLFRPVATAGEAAVHIRPGRPTRVECHPQASRAYRRCTVWAATPSTMTVRHELGHVLGLADHIRETDAAGGHHINPRLCDVLGDPRSSGYRGVMSYCDWGVTDVWFGVHDRGMLRRAGYLAPAELFRRAPPGTGLGAPRR